MELGVYSFGDLQPAIDGNNGTTAEAIRNLYAAGLHAEAVGLDFFGVGEHHLKEMPASSPGTILAALGAVTKSIKLGSTSTILGTDDPVRVYQQFATANIISGGRVEIAVGRGSSLETFPLFGYKMQDYAVLNAEKFDLLMQINHNENVQWSGKYRPTINGMDIVPRPERGLTIWVSTGGSEEPSIRAGKNGWPIFYGIIDQKLDHFAERASTYQQAALTAGHNPEKIRMSIATLGLVMEDDADAKDVSYNQWSQLFTFMKRYTRKAGLPNPSREMFNSLVAEDGNNFAGDPENVARRIVRAQKMIGHSRHIIQGDIAGLPHTVLLKSIELFATEVAPRVERLLRSKA